MKTAKTLAKCASAIATVVIWLGIMLLIVIGLLSLSIAEGATPESRVHVLHALIVASAGPDLPDSLKSRPRKNPEVLDLFREYDQPDELTEEELDRRLAECQEVECMKWMLQEAFSKWTVVYATAPGCPPCKQFEKGGWKDLAANGWHLFKFDVAEKPFLAEWFDITVTPTVILLKDGEEVGRLTGGDVTAQDVKRLAEPPQQKRSSTAPQRRAIGPSESCIAYRGRWTWPGGTISSLRRHMVGPPHNYPASIVAEMSPGQLIAAHDRWHDQYGSGGRIRLRMRRVSAESGENTVEIDSAA